MELTRRHLSGLLLSATAMAQARKGRIPPSNKAPAAALKPLPVTSLPPTPNFVIVVVDDLRFDALRCTGLRAAETPHIDALAREGISFENAFCSTPLGSPSLASILTGQFATRHNILDSTERGPKSHELITFPRLLQEAGYETGFYGKWHMGADPSPRLGFNRWVSFAGAGEYMDPALNVDGREQKRTGYLTDILNEEAAHFATLSHGRPFCLVLSHRGISAPYVPSARHKGQLTSWKVTRQANAEDDLLTKPALTRTVNGMPAVRPGSGPSDEVIRNQIRCLCAVDDGIGLLRAALDKAKLLDNTIILFTSTNGSFWGEHGLGDRRWAYEEALRIPLLLRLPKMITNETRISNDVQAIDLAPTILEMSSMRVPAPMQGQSLLPLLQKAASPLASVEAPAWRDAIFAEYFAEKTFPRVPSWQCLRTKEWKLIHYPDLPAAGELYSMLDDRGEVKNLFGDASMAAQRTKMQELLKLRVAEIS
jgi:arylsulfatase A-like enzyme